MVKPKTANDRARIVVEKFIEASRIEIAARKAEAEAKLLAGALFGGDEAKA